MNDRSWAAAELHAAAALLSGTRWAKVRRMLLDERTLTFLDRLHEDLAVAEPCAERRAALVARWRWQRSRPASAAAEASPAEVLGGVCEAMVAQQLGQEGTEAFRRVRRILQRVVRANSAVEGVNSVVRMHQARHRKASQELLDLKRLYWNCRRFVGGKRRQQCPYEHLGLGLPTYDAWSLLQMDPEQLEQQLSNQRLTG